MESQSCAKCGEGKFDSPRYCTGFCKNVFVPEELKKEHLHRKCGTCGFLGTFPTLDRKDSA